MMRTPTDPKKHSLSLDHRNPLLLAVFPFQPLQTLPRCNCSTEANATIAWQSIAKLIPNFACSIPHDSIPNQNKLLRIHVIYSYLFPSHTVMWSRNHYIAITQSKNKCLICKALRCMAQSKSLENTNAA